MANIPGGAVRVMLTGGGTGGHIYPALSIAGRLKEREPRAELLFVGTAEGMEASLVPRAGVPFAAIAARGLVGKSPLEALRGGLATLRGLGQALAVVRHFRPHVVVGTGGYASGPVALAAVASRIPLVLQEQNAVPGVTNRVLSRFASLVAVAYEESRPWFPPKARLVVTGNPVRPEVIRADRAQARRELGIPDGCHFVLVFMGSRGSATVNAAVADILPALARRPGVMVLFATGTAHFERVMGRLAGADLGPMVRVVPYLYDVVPPLAAADLVVARAGAITLAEVTARGLPSILIPSPYVTHNHQERNARVLEARGAAWVIKERDLSPGRLLDAITGLLADPEALARMGARSRELGRPEAVDAIVDGILALAGAGARRG